MTVAMGSTNTSAYTNNSGYEYPRMDVRDYRSPAPPSAFRDCRPANGAEIRGGFAGPGEWVDRETGEICYADPRPGVVY
jgi:hypothetical protein